MAYASLYIAHFLLPYSNERAFPSKSISTSISPSVLFRMRTMEPRSPLIRVIRIFALNYAVAGADHLITDFAGGLCCVIGLILSRMMLFSHPCKDSRRAFHGRNAWG